MSHESAGYAKAVKVHSNTAFWRILVLMLAGITALWILASLYVFMDPIYVDAPTPTTAPMVSKGAYSTPFLMAGIDRPPTRRAAEANLADEAQVIGVTAGGKARAYVLIAFIGPTKHIVNDLLGDVPVSITYCDLCDAVHVFTGDEKGVSLRINQGGRVQGRMVLHFEGSFYYQDTSEPIASNVPPFPYRNYPFQRCTWNEWRSAHPDSDAYVGVVAKP